VTSAIVSNAKTIQTKIFTSREQLNKLLPAGLDVDRFMQIAWGLVRQNPKLLECTPESIISGIGAGAQLGLSFDRVLGQAFLVPYWNGKARCREAQFQVGFRGLCQLAYRSERISAIWAEIIHKDDTFEDVRGTEPKLHHVVNLKVDRDKSEEWLGVYAVGKMKEGSTVFRVLSRSDVYDRRAKSKTWTRDQENRAKAEAEGKLFEPTSLWSTFEKDMWLKTAIRSLAKLLPQSADDRDAIRAAIEDEYRDAGVDLPTPELPAGSVEVETAALPAKNGGKTPPEASQPQERPFCTLTWREGGKQEVGVLSNVPYAVSEQSKFRDLFTKSGKVWYIQPTDFADAVALFDDCGFDLRLPPEASADSGAAVAPPSAAPREPGVDEEIGI
jgi:recombination protein RecT